MKVLKFRNREDTSDIFLPINMIFKYEAEDNDDATLLHCYSPHGSEVHRVLIDAETLVDKIFVIDSELDEIIEIGYNPGGDDEKLGLPELEPWDLMG